MSFKCKTTVQERELVLQWLKQGIGYTEISNKLNGKLSKQRIKQIAQKNNIDAFAIKQARKTKEYADKMFAKNGSKWDDPEFIKSLIFQSMKEKFTTKKKNNHGWEWTIEFGDLEFPSHCPVLGIELDYFTEGKGRLESSISFDRIDPTKGYIKGNVIVMSWRANRIKNDGTAQEHQQIANFMLSYLP